MKILVIEDDPMILDSITITLEINGYKVEVADSGAKGLEIAILMLPDLIISDIMMPKMDGYEVLEAVRATPTLANTPFLFLSARSDREDVRQGMNLGADDYLTKPFDIDDLLTSISYRLNKKQSLHNQVESKLEDLRASLRSNLPHEIRTPLNIILGYSNILLNSKNYDNVSDVREMIEAMNYGAIRLNQLFENYLLYASLELMEHKEIQRVRQNRTAISNDILREFLTNTISAYNRQNDIVFDFEEIYIDFSEYHYYKMIKELIDNAMKFSANGTRINVIGQPEEDNYRVTISDSGRGMSKSQIESIGAYQQFDRNLYEQQGAGLGLAIAKKIAELNKCKFIITSEQGRGTCVDILIPISSVQ